jgi:hypothetical protein
LQLRDKEPPSLFPRAPWEEERTLADPLDKAKTVRAVLTSIQVLESEGASFQDPGCAANDTVDGDLSDKVGVMLPVTVRGSLHRNTCNA